MTLDQDFEKIIIDDPEFRGILMVEPSIIPFYNFDCEMMQDFDFFKQGEKIQVDVIPLELGNKLILHNGKKESMKSEIKISQIKQIDTFEEQNDVMNKKNRFVKILLENNTDLILELGFKINEFISLLNSLSQLGKTYWEFFELKFSKGNDFRSTKIYFKTPFLARGEKLLWSFVGTEGILSKKASFVMALTSFRAIIYYFDTHECEYVLLPLTDEILVIDSRRVSQSTRKRGFSTVGSYGMRVDSGGNMEKEYSQTIGNVVFMKDGDKIITFGQMKDPYGLVSLAKAIKKNVIVQDKPII